MWSILQELPEIVIRFMLAMNLQRSPFRKPIAHGLLGLSFVAGLSSHSPAVATRAFVGMESWLFAMPLYVGDTVRVRS